MSAANTPEIKVDAPPLTNQDLARVENALEDMHIKETKADADPNIPPATFGAGGPMSVLAWLGERMRCLTRMQAEAVRPVNCDKQSSVPSGNSSAKLLEKPRKGYGGRASFTLTCHGRIRRKLNFWNWKPHA